MHGKLHYTTFDWLEPHAPFPCSIPQTVYILQKCHRDLTILISRLQTQSSAKTLDSESKPSVISFLYNENNNGTRTVPWGTGDEMNAQSDLIQLPPHVTV